MHRAALTENNSFEDFRTIARGFALAGIAPDKIVWVVGSAMELFGDAPPPPSTRPLTVPRAFVRLAEDVVCHRDPERFSLLYHLLWRLVAGERDLMADVSDLLVHRLVRKQKSVRRDMHKMTAFVRFRRIEIDGDERYVAWFEPEHHILRRVAPFFVDRFAAMRWSILSPHGALHWDRITLAIGAAVARSHAPTEDTIEDWWRSYYRSTSIRRAPIAPGCGQRCRRNIGTIFRRLI